MRQKTIQILDYRPEFAPYFERYNKAWLEAFFTIEPIDAYVLEHPEEAILDEGGRSLFVSSEGDIIGTVALKYMEPGCYELTKMAVGEQFRGMGAGTILCEAAIDTARSMGAHRVILYSNTFLKHAIDIYRRLGFTEVPVENETYLRADIKMEVLLRNDARTDQALTEIPFNQHNRMKTTKWFDRSFDTRMAAEGFASDLQRLESAVKRYATQLLQVDEKVANYQPDGKWSIKEHIGHLTILEPLWLKRFGEIQQGLEHLSPADLSNSATGKAAFNEQSIEQLLDTFDAMRTQTLRFLHTVVPEELSNTSIHPRLQQAMNIPGLAYFVAEHDDHHLAAIASILKNHSL